MHPWWTQAGSSWAVSKDMVHRTRLKKRKEKECKTSRPEIDGSSEQGKWLALPAHARKKRSSRNRRRGGPLRLPFRLLPTSKKPESSAARKYKERTELSFGSQIWCSKLASMKVTREEALKLCQLHDQIEALLHKHVAYENRHQSPRMENHVKEEKQSLQEKQRKKILWTRNISEANVAKLKRLCRKEGVKFVEEFDEEVTHLVTAEARGLCKTRSMKYLMGVMHGCWVLSEQWVEDSAGGGAFREEEAYEIRGDPYAAGAPRKSRTNSGCRKIFDGYFFHIAARKIAIQNETIAHIIRCIELGGGQLLDRPLAPNEESGQKVGTKCIVLCEPKAPRAVLAALRRKWGVEPLSYCWVLNSISQFVAVPEAQIHKYYISG